MGDDGAVRYLQTLVERGTSTVVLGGTRARRRQVVQRALSTTPASGQRHFDQANPGTADTLEALGKQGHFVVIFHDTHRIDPRTMWQIRSVAQFQQEVTYIFEGAHRNRMFDIVIRTEAAFYRQLTVVDIGRPNQPIW